MKFQQSITIVLLGLLGCGSTDRGVTARETGQAAFNKGIEQLAAKDYAAADESFQQAMAGELTADIFIEAAFSHAEALTGLEKYDDAIASIEQAAEGAELSRVHLAKAVVYRAKGDTKMQKAEFDKAKSFDRKAKMPK